MFDMKSPSKYISLARLLQIKKDNYIGEGGQEYCPFEVESLIAEKKGTTAHASVSRALKAQAESLADIEPRTEAQVIPTVQDKRVSLYIAELVQSGHRFIVRENVERVVLFPWERGA
jgi:hypothetical protein